MTATSPLRPSTPSNPFFNAPQLSPNKMPPASLTSGHRKLDIFSPVDQNGSFCFDRVIKSGKVLRRVKNKGAWKPSWKPAYLVLRPNLLSVYQNPDETDLKASITLSEVNAVAPVRKARTENVFGVFSPSKNYQFQGLSAKDSTDWIAHIRLEARTDEEDDIDLFAPQFSTREGEPTNTYESTDMSADEVPKARVSSEGHRTGVQIRSRKGSQLAHQPKPSSTLNEYSGNEQFTTSISDFSDALGSSLPKNSTSSLPKHPALTPIASSQQLASSSQPRLPAPTAPSSSHADPTTDPERVIRHGYLQILKSHKTGVKGWKWLWVVLRARSLAFYKDDQEYTAVKIFSMSSIINAAEIDPISKSKTFCFQVISDDKTYRFCANDEGDLEWWLGALKSVLSKRHEAEKALAKGKGKAITEGTAALSLR
ncbi:hypothetical protein LTR99_004656 [Exophiala xenobiotica]|uniref:ADP-ribosylation factor GTPase-activating protein n=1 Tax=Vermiconidia calcicola TaxID=1690605 RepID=A0AAV9QEF0_9PEZI|nr:hypothetical protein H2202_003087 [Exophiala xenobiotica]KAK5539937.1 hypothetical protein LTR25_003642 [Vermiconidia calcicola]KAK5546944.1 hypothetical protein LTR23_002947 [Chaetothyriales sp. CCFEE 6169]KAK5199860.1 hypothetical protein LTR92_000401 [Exophiala xenobiotica]KAK5211029.1 hypothetical protein LTR41_003641 [Exophiala xenobiotica]